jgi:hypothetical protein
MTPASPGPPAYQTPYATPNPNQHEIDLVVVHEVDGQTHDTPHFLDGTPVTSLNIG